MRLLVSVAAAIFATIGLMSSAEAQILKPEGNTGSLLQAQPKNLDAREIANIRKGFAQCLYSRAKRKSLALLAHSDMETVDLRAAGIRDLTKDLEMEPCLGEQVGVEQTALGLRFPVGVLRDLLAEEAYLAINPVAPAVTADASPAAFNLVSTGDHLASAQALTAFADCTVMHDTAHADALLRTKPGSDAERSTAAALAPALGQCLVAGQSLTLRPANIRAFMAYAMWSRYGRSKVTR